MTIAQNHPQPLPIDLNNTDIHLSPEQLERLRTNNPDLHLELTEDGKLIAFPSSSVAERVEASVVEEVPSPESNPISRSTSSGRDRFPELTPTEIARRVAAFERFQERQRQRWESLTPEERAEHDRQFEALYKSLEESRR
ncbi:hypothetical protein [Chamaesiphon polymorphus]|nr:hypothetical protein [Chamaesiphon polymorphus]